MYSKEKFLDDEVEKALESLKSVSPDGGKYERLLRGRLNSVKKRFVEMALAYCTDNFFESGDQHEAFVGFDKKNFEKAVRCAYDIRSKYVHTGISFGQWLAPRSQLSGDISFGTPVIDDGAFAKVLKSSATFLGLERIIRFCIIRFAMDNLLNLTHA